MIHFQLCIFFFFIFKKIYTALRVFEYNSYYFYKQNQHVSANMFNMAFVLVRILHHGNRFTFISIAFYFSFCVFINVIYFIVKVIFNKLFDFILYFWKFLHHIFVLLFQKVFWKSKTKMWWINFQKYWINSNNLLKMILMMK